MVTCQSWELTSLSEYATAILMHVLTLYVKLYRLLQSTSPLQIWHRSPPNSGAVQNCLREPGPENVLNLASRTVASHQKYIRSWAWNLDSDISPTPSPSYFTREMKSSKFVSIFDPQFKGSLVSKRSNAHERKRLPRNDAEQLVMNHHLFSLARGRASWLLRL